MHHSPSIDSGAGRRACDNDECYAAAEGAEERNQHQSRQREQKSERKENE